MFVRILNIPLCLMGDLLEARKDWRLSIYLFFSKQLLLCHKLLKYELHSDVKSFIDNLFPL